MNGIVKNMKEKVSGLVMVITFIIFMIFFFIYIENQWDKQFANLNKESPPLTTVTSMRVKVASLYEPEGLKGSPYVAFITLQGGEKIKLYVNMRKLPLADLMDIMEIGDSIVKETGTDSLYVIKTVNGITEKHGFTLFKEKTK